MKETAFKVSPTKAAQLLGVPVDRVRAWCESRLLPSYRSIHNRRTIDRKELVAFGQRHPEHIAPPRIPARPKRPTHRQTHS